MLVKQGAAVTFVASIGHSNDRILVASKHLLEARSCALVYLAEDVLGELLGLNKDVLKEEFHRWLSFDVQKHVYTLLTVLLRRVLVTEALSDVQLVTSGALLNK